MRFRSIFTNSIGILVSRIFGFIRDLLTASVLGANIYSDIFFVAFKLPNLFRRVFAEGAFTQSFLPSYIASKNRSLFSVVVLIRFFLFLLFISTLVTIFSEEITKIIAFGFSEETVKSAAPLVAINFYYLNFIFLVTFLSALLQYREHFATTAFSTALLNISMICALVFFRDKEPQTIVYALSYSVLIGGFLQLVVHLISAKKEGVCKTLIGGFTYLKRKKKAVKSELNKFNKNFFPSVLGNSTAQLSSFIDTWLASFLVSGSISYLFYANRLFQLPLALFATAASIALFPSISKLLKKGDILKAKNESKSTFWFLVALLGGASAFGIILSEEIVKLLFERGAFSSLDTLNTSSVLIMYMIGLLPFGLAKLFSLWLYADHRQVEAAKIAAKALGFNILFSILLIVPLKAPGLALASSIGGWVLLYLTIKALGDKLFLDIIRSKKAPLALAFIAVCIFSAFGLKVVLDGDL